MGKLKRQKNQSAGGQGLVNLPKADSFGDARRLERIESLEAEKRMKAGKADPMETFPQGTTRDTVASKLGIGSRDTYRNATW